MGNVLKTWKQHPSFLYEPLINPPNLEEVENKNLSVFGLKELKKATKNFRKDRVVTGEDDFVRTFYKGYINENTSAPSRTKIAVSVVECLSQAQEELNIYELQEEAESLGQISHPNLVRLLGYCCEDNKSLLVYEYFPKESLDHHMFEKEDALPWETRVKIAIGIAQGTAFVHSIKNSPLDQELRMHNIMLDEHYNAKLFYLKPKKQCRPIDWAFSGGTVYLSPECVTSGLLRMESDVFTFGVILLVLFTGSKDIAKNLKRIHTKSFLMGEEIIDPRLGSDYPVNAATKMGTLIQICTMWDWKKRPLMQQVLDVLNSIAEIKD